MTASKRLIPLLVGALFLTGCGNPRPPMDFSGLPDCLADASGKIALALGARANQPAPVLPKDLRTMLLRASYDSQRIAVVGVDGDPRVQFSATFNTTAQNEIAWRADLETFVVAVADKIAKLRATTAEANPLEALARASDEAGPGGTVVLFDSGLQTLAPLNFRRDGQLDADPADVADFLQRSKHLPHLKGQTLVLAGIGKTEKPQQSLDTAHRDNLLAIWQEIGVRAGVRCVGLITETQQAAALTDVPEVSPVPIPSPQEPPKKCTQAMLRDSGKVRFKPNKAIFVNAHDARVALQAYATHIIDEHLSVHLIGTTASAGNSEEGKKQLSLARADAVKEVLISLGVSAAVITTEGLGYHYDGYVTDRDADGDLIPEKAALNRNVIVQFRGCAKA